MATPNPTGTFVAPVTPLVVTSDYGDRYIPDYDFHEGVDFQAQTPVPVAAMDGGVVLFAGFREDGFGNRVIIDHGNGIISAYAHLSAVSVQKDQVVGQGQRIATSGNTGYSQAPHLHVEVNAGGDVAAYRRGQIRYPGARHFDAEPYVGTGRSYSEQATLQRGDKLSAVTELQRSLKTLGYDLGTTGPNRDGVDGDFGRATQQAVQAFQRDRGLPTNQQKGIYGPITRGEMREAVQAGWRRPGVPAATPPAGSTPQGQTPPPSPPPPAPNTPNPPPPVQTTPSPTAPAPTGPGTFVDTRGPFSAVSTGALLDTRQGTPLGALTGDPSYALGRAVFGDGPGAAALQLIDQRLGTGSGVFVQRMIALGQHEGVLNVGRRNADPNSGSNIGTFQVGGAGSTPAETQARYDALLARGLREYEALGGPHVDPARLTVAERDVFAHIGHMTDRAANVYGDPPDALLRQMADPTVQGDALVRLVHDRVQGGQVKDGRRPIGEDVVRMTDPSQRFLVDLAAVAARGNEPDALRREPSMPILDNRLRWSYSPAVEAWQQILIARGLPIGADAPDGRYGSTTRSSTQALQREAGIQPADGVVGPDTWRRFSTVGARTVDGRQTPTTPDQTTTDPTTTTQTTPGQTTTQTTPNGDGTTTPLPLQTTPGQTPTTPGRLDDPSAVFLREADTLVANVLDRHTGNVPGALDALVTASRGLGSGPLGATTPEDVQRAFDRFSAGDPTARPLSRAEAAAIAPVLDARTRLIAEGTAPAPAVVPPVVPSGDGAGRTTPEPMLTQPQLPTETVPRL